MEGEARFLTWSWRGERGAMEEGKRGEENQYLLVPSALFPDVAYGTVGDGKRGIGHSPIALVR